MSIISPIGGQDVAAEVRESNQVADTISSLTTLIQRYGAELARIKGELKNKRESLKSVFDNDEALSQAQGRAELVMDEVKVIKTQLSHDPQIVSLKVQVSELNDQKKEIEEALSNHLVNYSHITNSSSFDTMSGDQCDFKVTAKISAKQLKLFES